jgi:protein TonB
VLFGVNFRAPTISVHADNGWAVQQDPYGWESAYPKPALAAAVSGQAVVECKGASGKKFATCTVVGETPDGQGFGDAALELRARILIKPPPASAASTGHTLRLTVTFHAPPKPG